MFVITQILSGHISVNLIMDCEIPWKSIESSACPLGARPPFLPPGSWFKPRQGWPVYSTGAATPLLLFVFQRRGSGPPIESRVRRAAEKQKEG
jgi:hypothetical protein